ncbi:MAG: hypothetical protein ACLU7D_11390 [Collinsella sp.]
MPELSAVGGAIVSRPDTTGAPSCTSRGGLMFFGLLNYIGGTPGVPGSPHMIYAIRRAHSSLPFWRFVIEFITYRPMTATNTPASLRPSDQTSSVVI